ncbi:MAG: energy-coupled thiamine transporter ThiT [Erysipelotrichaceae bacterium]|nr:energy-coupled thiamine transporter ThiT [Erysipelotrichaceae bacterium]
MKAKNYVYIAVYVAMFIVFDYISNAFSLFKMPNGGTLGISSIVLLLASYKLGWKQGLGISCLSVLIQFVTGPMYIPNIWGLLLDYILAFSIYGIASKFPNYGYFYTGVLITNVFRYLFHSLGGVVVWETEVIASLIYNATYMIPTTILGMILVPLLHKRLSKI